MALSTTQYGYIIDPMVPFTDGKGNTIKDGFVRVFVAGSSTPVVTYRNFDGATNQVLIELDNSGRTKTSVIGSKGLTYKVCVYDQLHSQESPILTVDKVSVIGANITAVAGATVVTGLDGLTTKPDGFVDASVVGTDGYVALDHTLVTDDLDTDAKVTAVEDDRYIPLLNGDVNDPDSKITLGLLWQWVLGKIKSLSTTITAFRNGDYIALDGPSGTAKMGKDDLLKCTAYSTLVGKTEELSSSGYFIAVSTNKWKLSTLYTADYYGAIIDVTQYRGAYVKIKANSTNRTGYCFTKDTPSDGADVVYCDGYAGQVFINAGESDVIRIPDDAVSLFVYMHSPGVDYTPEQVFVPAGLETVLNNYLDTELRGDERTLTSSGYFIAVSTNKWKLSTLDTADYYGAIIDVTQYRGAYVKIKANSTNRTGYCFTKDTPSDGADVVYCDGYAGQVFINAGESDVIRIPDDAVSLFVYMHSPGVDYTPEQVFVPAGLENSKANEDELTVTKEQINYLDTELRGDERTLTSSGYFIAVSTNKWKLSTLDTADYYGAIIDVTQYRGAYVKIKANSTNRTGYCFTKDTPSDGADVVYCDGYAGQVFINAGESDVIRIPDDAVSLFVYMHSPGVDYTPEQVFVPAGLENSKANEDELTVTKEQLTVTKELIRSQAKNGIIVATWNIGHFSMGGYKNSTITSADYATKLAAFRTLINDDVKAAVIGVEEYSAIFGNDGTKDQPTRSKLFFDYGIAYEGFQRNYSCDAVFGDTVIENIMRHEYECLEDETITHTSAITAQDYYYIDFDLYIKGVKVKFVVTHLAFDSNRPGVLQQKQIEELANKYGSYDYCVIVGDFNVNSEEDFTAIDDAGFGRANGGRLITFPGGNKSLDEICVKGLSYDLAQMEDCSSLSDHNLIWTKITYEG